MYGGFRRCAPDGEALPELEAETKIDKWGLWVDSDFENVTGEGDDMDFEQRLN